MIKLKNIAVQVLNEAELKTYGDLKNLLKAIKKKQVKGTLISKGKEIAIDTALEMIPGAAIAKNAFSFFKAAYEKPDTKKTDTWLDNLDIDDQVSAIVDDTVEQGFLEALVKSVESESDDKELEKDFNMNTKLSDYLADEYKGRTVSYTKINLKK